MFWKKICMIVFTSWERRKFYLGFRNLEVIKEKMDILDYIKIIFYIVKFIVNK